MKFKFALLLALLILFSCGKNQELVPIIGWEWYNDPYYNINFRHPLGWTVIPEGGRFSVFSSPDVMNRFYDYSIKGKDGIRLVISTQKVDTLKTINQYINELKTDLANSGFDIIDTSASTLASLPASHIHYKGLIDKNNTLEAIQVSAIKDTNLYTIKYEAFNKLFSPYKMVFDTALASLQLPKPKVAISTVDLSIPSSNYEKFENDRLSISYPNNFETFFPKQKPPNEFSIDIKGYRQDSYIHLDIIPAKNLTTEKIVEQNAKFYKEISRGTATIDGVQATFINYSPVKDIQSRVYFTVKNDRFYRIIINYYAPMRSVYLPVFEKTVASLIIK